MDNEFPELKDGAAKLKVAEHVLTQTYPLLKDPKILLAVIENIFLGMVYAMNSLLYFERKYKKIPPFGDSFSARISMFKDKLANHYKIKNQYILLLMDLNEMIRKHKESPIEFRRKDHFVICDDGYNMETIGTPKIKEYLTKANEFVHIIENIAKKQRNLY